MSILIGISLTLNVLSGIMFFIIYKFGFKGIKRKIENYTFDLMDIDKDFYDDLDIKSLRGDKK